MYALILCAMMAHMAQNVNISMKNIAIAFKYIKNIYNERTCFYQCDSDAL